MNKPIEVVKATIDIQLPITQIQGYRDNSSDGLADYTDTEIANILLEDIVLRYFNEEYFDLQGLFEVLS